MRYRVDHKPLPTAAIPNPRWIYGDTTDELYALIHYHRFAGYERRMVSLQATYSTSIEREMTADQIDALDKSAYRAGFNARGYL